MKNTVQKNRQYLTRCKEDLERAEKLGDPGKYSLALANYAYALGINKKFEQGVENFNQAEILAGTQVEDVNVLVQGLSLRALMYQEAKRLPDAFRTVGRILQIAEKEDDRGIECDALANQGQILLESGEFMESFSRFQRAEQLAQQLGDRARLMRLKGALANLSLSVPSLEKAELYYRQGLELARELDDRETEMGYLGNLGTVLAWQGSHREAIQVFEKVLIYYQEKGDDEKVIQVLRKLVASHNQLENNQKVMEYAFQGIDLLDDQDDEVVFDFLEAVILSYFRQGKVQQAQNMIADAITIARSSEDKAREVEFLINLGESFLASEMIERALKIYQEALVGAEELKQQSFQAYLTGRLGYAYAELGDLKKAVEHHQQAIALAQENHLAELEGSQHSMLAVTYRELGKNEKALDHGQKAVEIFQLAELEAEKEQAQNLVDEIRAQA